MPEKKSFDPTRTETERAATRESIEGEIEPTVEIKIDKDTKHWSGSDYELAPGIFESYMVYYPEGKPIVWVFETAHVDQNGKSKKSYRIKVEREGSDQLVSESEANVEVSFDPSWTHVPRS